MDNTTALVGLALRLPNSRPLLPVHQLPAQLLLPSGFADASACQQLLLAHVPQIVQKPNTQAAWALGSVSSRQLSCQAAAGMKGGRHANR